MIIDTKAFPVYPGLLLYRPQTILDPGSGILEGNEDANAIRWGHEIKLTQVERYNQKNFGFILQSERVQLGPRSAR